MTAKHPEIKTRTIVMIVIMYTLITNLGDLKNGLIAGWNAAGITAQSIH